MADPILISSLTKHGEGYDNGATPPGEDGVFDAMMTAVDYHLNVQWEKQRIRGSDYAQTYLGAMQWAMQQSVQFLLQKEQSEQNVEKTEAEVAFLWQKKITEQAQTEDGTTAIIAPVDPRAYNYSITTDPAKAAWDQTQYPLGPSGTHPVTGAVGKQIGLQQAQIDGYERDAEQKAAKLLLDAWSVRISVEGAAGDVPEVFTNPVITEIFNNLRFGIGVSTADVGLGEGAVVEQNDPGTGNVATPFPDQIV